MRRFELVEGSSSKFWEVEIAGRDVTTRWGRIGTSGQFKTKTFDSPAAAAIEHDSLVREKTKKGYQEVGGAAAPANVAIASAPVVKPKKGVAKPAPAPAPAPAPEPEPAPAPEPALPQAPPLAESSTPSIAWTDAIRRRLPPRRREGTPPIGVDASKAYERVQESFGHIAKLWSKSKSKDDPAVAAMLARAQAKLSTKSEVPPAPADATLEGFIMTMLTQRVNYNDKDPPLDAYVDYWVGTAGLTFAVEALAASLEFRLAQTYSGPAEIHPYTSGRQGAPQFVVGVLGTFARLRAHLAAAGATTWESARLAAERLRQGGALHVRIALDYLFPDVPAWAEEDAKQALATIGVSRMVGSLLTCIRDPALMEQLVSGHSNAYAVIPGTRGHRQDYFEVAAAMLDSAGPAAARAVAMIVDLSVSSDDKREAAQVLALVDSDEGLGLLLERAEQKEVVPVVSDAVTRQPRRAIPLLAARAVQSRSSLFAEPLLAALVKQHPELADELAPSLPEASRRLIATIRARYAPVQDAPADALPPLLVSPPWTRKRRGGDANVVNVTLAEFPEAVVWEQGQRDAWARDARSRLWFEQKTPEERVAWILGRFGVRDAVALRDKGMDQLREMARATDGKQGFSDPSWLSYVPEDFAVAFWEELPVGTWSSYSPPSGLLSSLELKALPGLLRVAAARPQHYVEWLQPFRSPRAAPVVAHAFLRLKSTRIVSQRWLLQHDECAAVGLIPDAVGRPGPAREAAGAALRYLASNGRGNAIAAAAQRYSEDARAALQAVLDFDPLDLFPSKLPKLPSFFQPAAFTRPKLRGSSLALPVSSLEHLAIMCAFSQLDAPYAGIAQVKQACDPQSLAAFAWELFSAWLMAGASSKEQWAMNAMGLLGDDTCARKLAPLIRAWPGESAHARAVAGLDVLAAIGTDVALMHLNGIAQKVKFKGLQERARDKIALIAEQRDLTPEELADRLVPDLGLEADGSMTLDFGSRSFRVGFDEHLRPLVRDATGKALPDLPKPGKSDDADKAVTAQATWKALKKDVKTLSSQQLLRLELAMASARRWTPDVFRMFLVEHPLIQHLVRRLVWGVFDDTGNLATTFRVTEDGSFATSEDDPFELPTSGAIGIVHSLVLDTDTAARWGQVFGDYEILQPFKQLGREAFVIEEAEREARELARFDGLRVPTGKVLGLEARGWRRGAPQDGGGIWWFEKTLRSDGLQAHLQIDPGIIVGMVTENPEQRLGKLTLEAEGSWGNQRIEIFGALDPMTFSELVRDLEGLRSS